MDNEIVLSKDDEEFLDSLFKESEYVCVNCLSSADVDEDQKYTYCEFCESFTEVKKREQPEFISQHLTISYLKSPNSVLSASCYYTA